jgi:hypothetical protein
MHDLHAFDPATKAWETLPANELRVRLSVTIESTDGPALSFLRAHAMIIASIYINTGPRGRRRDGH